MAVVAGEGPAHGQWIQRPCGWPGRQARSPGLARGLQTPIPPPAAPASRPSAPAPCSCGNGGRRPQRGWRPAGQGGGGRQRDTEEWLGAPPFPIMPSAQQRSYVWSRPLLGIRPPGFIILLQAQMTLETRPGPGRPPGPAPRPHSLAPTPPRAAPSSPDALRWSFPPQPSTPVRSHPAASNDDPSLQRRPLSLADLGQAWRTCRPV